MIRGYTLGRERNWLSENMRHGTLHDIYSNIGGDCKLPYAHASKVSRTTLGRLIDNIIADYRLRILKQPDHAQPFFYSFLRYSASPRSLGENSSLHNDNPLVEVLSLSPPPPSPLVNPTFQSRDSLVFAASWIGRVCTRPANFKTS
jgi:hypothetical protein